MSNNTGLQKPFVNRHAFAVCAICALAIVSMTWYSHSLTSGTAPSAAAAKKAASPSGAGTHNSAGVDSSLAIPVRQWVGKKFIVLDKPKLFRKFGYELYLTKDLSTSIRHIDTSLETDKHHLRYDRYCGRTITVVAVEPLADEWLISFSQERGGPQLYAKTHKGAVEGIALTEDLDKAAAQWVGRTVYSRRRFIDTYDSANGAFGTLKVNIQDRLKVTVVRWGTTPLPPKPLWLCVTTNDKETGFIPVSQSWTNVMKDKIGGQLPWGEDVFEKNPLEIYSWDSSIWSAINSHTIVSGMNREQVRVSWGPPHRVVTDTLKQRCVEQWMYGNQFLCFDHDTVSSIGAR
jgi:hypothetical protein